MASWKRTTIVAMPLAAVAVLALASCSANENASDVPGTTPPVFTSSAPPAGMESHGGESHGGEAEGGSESGAASADMTGDLRDPSGASVGTVSFTEEDGHLKVTVEAEGLTPGFHGLHMHQNPVCEPNSVAPTGGEPGDFLSAGGHLQVGGNTGHPASGDLTSLQAREDGTATLTTTTDAVTLDDLSGGVAVIVHAGADNFANIPPRYTLPDGAAVPDATTLATGDAGGRVACAVVEAE
ncbi:superoxide dismutase[Cu-Zn] [Rhodococcoides corynebacterioides]|uniref:superoxide dismutase[Cu-Zn] n=1 Tax=Rhodococcoides corynebacterioides TaxID=53972 RepID=UPI000832D254|nr:superoxide dismutase family protein [Rhodococcus corynebacterioides]MBY6349404.1 superoxide dismutase family protein [Rhodococcus corynebacterioides]MBY6362688.1 superoxide dismutase family protein [Rhodococcus corynebacterioides]